MIEFIKKHYGKIGMSFALVMLVINYFQRQELAELRIKTSIQTESLGGGDNDGELLYDTDGDADGEDDSGGR